MVSTQKGYGLVTTQSFFLVWLWFWGFLVSTRLVVTTKKVMVLVTTQSFFLLGIDSFSGFEQKGYGVGNSKRSSNCCSTDINNCFFSKLWTCHLCLEEKTTLPLFCSFWKKKKSHLKKRTQKEPNKPSTPLGKKKLEVTILLRRSKSKLSFLFVSCNNNVTCNFF